MRATLKVHTLGGGAAAGVRGAMAAAAAPAKAGGQPKKPTRFSGPQFMTDTGDDDGIPFADMADDALRVRAATVRACWSSRSPVAECALLAPHRQELCLSVMRSTVDCEASTHVPGSAAAQRQCMMVPRCWQCAAACFIVHLTHAPFPWSGPESLCQSSDRSISVESDQTKQPSCPIAATLPCCAGPAGDRAAEEWGAQHVAADSAHVRRVAAGGEARPRCQAQGPLGRHPPGAGVAAAFAGMALAAWPPLARSPGLPISSSCSPACLFMACEASAAYRRTAQEQAQNSRNNGETG